MSDYATVPIDEMETFHNGLYRRARAHLGVESFGLAVIELGPNSDAYPKHDHAGPDGQEEVLLVLSGHGVLCVDDDELDLFPEMIVRIGPTVERLILPGEDGMRLLAIGGVPGEAYEPPSYTEIGAPDPLAG